MVDSQNVDLVVSDRVDDRVRKTPHEKSTSPMPPDGSEPGMREKQGHRALELAKDLLHQGCPGALTVVARRLAEILPGLWV